LRQAELLCPLPRVDTGAEDLIRTQMVPETVPQCFSALGKSRRYYPFKVPE
jgi:hypothetical protein